jgi:hypothetical protein
MSRLNVLAFGLLQLRCSHRWWGVSNCEWVALTEYLGGKAAIGLQGYGFRSTRWLSRDEVGKEVFLKRLCDLNSESPSFGSVTGFILRMPNWDAYATNNCDICPVLKHGPRSLTYVRVCG